MAGIKKLERPEIAAQWDFDKNGGRSLDDFSETSSENVWCKCSLGHSWQSAVRNFAVGRTSCPYCTGKKVLQGFNDLRTTHPHLAAEWDYDKNGDVRPEDTYSGYTSYAWWLCANGHSWRALIRSRRKHGCPYCSGQFVLAGFNDLATLKPELAAEWDCEKNGDARPENVTKHSGNKAWWLCEKGHSWQATIASRSSGGGCPYCTGKAILPGYNDMLTIAPKLAREWDYVRNKNLQPNTLAITSRIKVWWKCSLGHSWLISPFSRSKGTGCPYCAGKRPVMLKFVT